MRRTKSWWDSLTSAERTELYWLERNNFTRSPYLHPVLSECGNCGKIITMSGLCSSCADRLDEIINKANSAGAIK